MASPDRLSQLVGALESSLVMYLADSGIDSYPGAAEIKQRLAAAVADHRALLTRAAEILVDREVPLPRTAYPIAFTAIHDLDLRALLPRVVGSLERQARDCDAIAAAARDDAAAAELAAEAASSTRRHLDSLRDLAPRLQAGIAG